VAACLAGLVALAGVALAAPGPAAKTKLVSLSSAGAQGDGASYGPGISGNGRVVAFTSESTNLVAGDTNGTTDVFVRDLHSHKTKRASVSSTGAQGDGASVGYPVTISDNGRYVAFSSSATNLVTGDSNAASDVFVRDLKLHRTKRVSVSSAGAEANGLSDSPVISADGHSVAFASAATNLVSGDTNGVSDVFVRNLKTHTTKRVSVDSAGAEGNSGSFTPTISGDGHLVGFRSQASNLVAGDTNGAEDIFVRDLKTHKTRRVSLRSTGGQGNGPSFEPSISADGRFVGFESAATDLVSGDTNATDDIFVRDLKNHRTKRVSVGAGGVQSNGISYFIDPSISAHGRFVVFASAGTNLVPGDTNGQTDAFIRDLAKDRTRRLSVSSTGGQGDSYSFDPSITSDGRSAAFVSAATNLVSGDTNGKFDIFVRGPLRP
jgi:Tol biopolymer transport system component